MEEGQGSKSFAPASIFSTSVNSEQSAFGNSNSFASSSSNPTSGFAARGRGAPRGRRGSLNPSFVRTQPSSNAASFANRSVVFNTNPASSATFNEDDGEEGEENNYGQSPASEYNPLNTTISNASDSSYTQIEGGSFNNAKVDSSQAIQSKGNVASIFNVAAASPNPSNLTSTNVLGGSKENDESRKKRFEDLPKQNRFFEMKHQRDALRLEYIRQGVLPDPDKAQDLSAAKSLLGTCMEMCPEFEREEREFQNEGDVLEMFPGTSRIDPALAVKIYRRPAAGRELPLPEDVRPPTILRKTLDYLFHQLLPSDPASTQFTAVQPFMWNRTRAIRQDFIVQGLRGDLEIECHERIARYHILCLHWKGGIGAEGWSEQQELEQLRKTIRSLTEFYEDLRRSTGKSSANEAEFRAYNLLLHMQDPETLREVEVLPADIFDSPSVQAALRLRGYAQRSNNVVKRGRPLNTEATMNLWTRFFGEIKRNEDVSYLLACLAENAFSQVRAGALKAMGKTYLAQHAPLPLEYLRRSLGMDNVEEARIFGVALNCEEARTGGMETPVNAMRLGKASEEKPLPSAPFSKTIVEVKRGSQSSQAIVDGSLSGAAPLLPVQGGPIVSKAQVANIRSKVSSIEKSAPITKSLPSSSLLPPAPLFSPIQAKVVTADQSTLPSRPIAAASAASTTSSAFNSSLSAAAPIFRPSTLQTSIDKKPDITFSSLPPTSTATSKGFTSQFSFQSQVQQSPSSTLPIASKPSSFAAIPAITPVATSASTPITRKEEGANGVPQTSNEKEHEEPRSTSIKESKEINYSEENPLPLQTIPPHSKIEAPPKSKRSVASVSASLFDRLLCDLVKHKVESIGEQACLRELRIRRKRIRDQQIEQTTELLLEMARGEVVEDIMVTLASEAIAKEFRTRSLENLTLLGRKRAVEKAMERKRQAERLLEVRSKLAKRGLPFPASKEGQHLKHKVVSNALEDQELQEALLQAKTERMNLWKPSTFLHCIQERLHAIASLSSKPWAVGLSIADEETSASKWLRLKLSAGEGALDERSNQGNVLQMIDLSNDSPKNIEKEGDMGMVVFELNIPITSFDDAGEWTLQRQRLEFVSQQSVVQDSHYYPKLLIVSWTSGRTKHEGEWCRKKILRELRLGAMDAQRFRWGTIEICCLGDYVQSPQADFEKNVEAILKTIELNPRKLRLNLETVLSMCRASWKNLLNHVDVAFSQQDNALKSGKSEKRVAMQTFITLTILANQTFNDLLSVSNTLFEDQLEDGGSGGVVVIPLSPQSAKEKEDMIDEADNVNQFLLSIALMQLEECHRQTNNECFSLYQSWLLEQYERQERAMARFPWLAYFERIYQWFSLQFEEVWLECKFQNRKEVESHLSLTSNLCKAAWMEIEWKVKEFDATTPTKKGSPLSSSSPFLSSSSPRKRRGNEKDVIIDSEPTSKSRRVDRSSAKLVTTTSISTSNSTTTTTTSPPTLPPSRRTFISPPASSRSSSLRALMASANHLLEEPNRH